MILYIETLKDFTPTKKKLLGLINKFSQAAKNKISMQNKVVVLQ